jgi:hypothetical protein
MACAVLADLSAVLISLRRRHLTNLSNDWCVQMRDALTPM